MKRRPAIIRLLFGHRDFYKKVFKITFPIMIQQLLVNLVSLADNLMVGNLNDDVISGVYIANKITFVVILALFGAMEGASVFFAQFFGNDDIDHQKQCFNFKVYADIVISLLCSFIFLFFGKQIALAFVNDTRASIAYDYMKIIAFSFPIFGVTQALSTSYRESHQAKVPMFSSLLSLITNIGLNALFIFGLNMGAQGAAIATLIARLTELIFMVSYSIIKKPSFINNILENPKIEGFLFKEILIRSVPLFLNEILWSVGQTMLVFAFSRVIDYATDSLSIATTLHDFCYLATIALGNGVAVIMGNTLGENNILEAKKQVGYFNTLTVIISTIFGGLLIIVSHLLTNFYNVSQEAKNLSILMCYANAVLFPIMSLNTSIFFMIRSGGLTKVVMIFDSVFVWLIEVPIALFLSYKTNISLENQFFLVYSTEIIKLVAGAFILKKGIWIKNLTQ